jgi:hypothetical protein
MASRKPQPPFLYSFQGSTVYQKKCCLGSLWEEIDWSGDPLVDPASRSRLRLMLLTPHQLPGGWYETPR